MMSEAQWIAYGAILRQIHRMATAPVLAHAMRRETVVPTGATTVREVDEHLGRHPLVDLVGQHLAALWHERRDVIRTLVARAEELGQQLAQKAPPMCCATRTS